MTLTREQILASSQRLRAVEVADWNGTVYVRAMMQGEYEKFQIMCLAGKDDPVKLAEFKRYYVACCLADEKGARLFQDSEIELLKNVSAGGLEAIFQAAQEHNGHGKDDDAKKE